MKILMASGGSGGHIYPSLSLSKELSKKDKVCFIGYKNHMEDKIIDKSEYEFYGIDKCKNKYLGLIENYKNIKKTIKKINPDLVIGWGNSLSFLSVLAAKRLKIKTIIHEQNIIPGKANKMSSFFVDDVITSFEGSERFFKNSLCLGNPRGEEATSFSNYKYKVRKDMMNVLIVMGSLGSSSVISFITSFLNKVKINAHFIISVGKNVEIKDEISNLNDVEICDYIDDLPSLMKNVDLMISRAGATTLSEIESLNVVSILIPSPYVTNNHQYLNAKYMKDKNLAMVIEEKNLNHKRLKNMIENKSEQLRIKMNLMSNKKKKGITDFVKLIDDKYRV